jgi:hypothetical protein
LSIPREVVRPPSRKDDSFRFIHPHSYAIEREAGVSQSTPNLPTLAGFASGLISLRIGLLGNLYLALSLCYTQTARRYTFLNNARDEACCKRSNLNKQEPASATLRICHEELKGKVRSSSSAVYLSLNHHIVVTIWRAE